MRDSNALKARMTRSSRRRRSMHLRRLVTLACAMSLILIGLDAPVAVAATYNGGATVVVKPVGGEASVDVGTVVCRPGTNSGTGGACVPFGTGNAIRVNDIVAGSAVAFQVCIDNDGNGKCGGLPTVPNCFDRVFYSHNDAGTIFNPLGPLPTGFNAGCPGGKFKGYIVFLCQGVHIDGNIPHVHIARSGTATLVTGGTGFGNFCGPLEAFDPRFPPKTYYVL